MLCVTIIAVSLPASTICAVSSSTNAAVFGSSAAVCSSSSRMRDGCSDAISRLTAWRWPPESRPMRSARRFSSPSLRMLSFSRNSSRSLRLSEKPKPRRAPRFQASAMFSSIVSASQVPAIGSWKTRATRSERCQAERRVTSLSSIWMRAAIDHQVAADGVEEGRLAGAVGADHGDELAGGDLQVQSAQHPVLDRRAGVEGDLESFGAQHYLASLMDGCRIARARAGHRPASLRL